MLLEHAKVSLEQNQQQEDQLLSLTKSHATASRERAELLESTQQLQRSLDDAYAQIESQSKEHDSIKIRLESQVSGLHKRIRSQDDQLAAEFLPLSQRASQLEAENLELRRKEAELETALDIAKSSVRFSFVWFLFEYSECAAATLLPCAVRLVCAV